MSVLEMRKININVITNKKDQSIAVPKMIYRNLSLRERLNRKIDIDYISKNIVEKKFYYHPFWVAKLLVIAERKPFSPKVTPQMVFIDAITGYRGILSSVPYVKEDDVDSIDLMKPFISSEERVQKYIIDIQINQINNLYMIKKPIYETKDVALHYIPFYKVQVKSPLINKELLLNVNTGEHEDYLWSRLNKTILETSLLVQT